MGSIFEISYLENNQLYIGVVLQFQEYFEVAENIKDPVYTIQPLLKKERSFTRV